MFIKNIRANLSEMLLGNKSCVQPGQLSAGAWASHLLLGSY